MLHELALKHNASGGTPLQLLAKMLTQDVQCKAHHQGLYLMLAAAASQCLASPMDEQCPEPPDRVSRCAAKSCQGTSFWQRTLIPTQEVTGLAHDGSSLCPFSSLAAHIGAQLRMSKGWLTHGACRILAC